MICIGCKWLDHQSGEASVEESAYTLDTAFVQGLCDRFSVEFGLTVSVMGKDGAILASSARERIGNRHEVAARIVNGEMDELLVSRWQALRSRTMRPGCNTALNFRGCRIASLGVAGAPKTAQRFAQVIKF